MRSLRHVRVRRDRKIVAVIGRSVGQPTGAKNRGGGRVWDLLVATGKLKNGRLGGYILERFDDSQVVAVAGMCGAVR